METSAIFSPCGSYRYALWRRWAPGAYAMFVGLNPSTADETNDDPTIRRCVRFAQSWGYSALCMTNLFAYRATKPEDMKAAPEPLGFENDRVLLAMSSQAAIAIAAWGTDGPCKARDQAVRRLIPRLHYLRLTKDGHPQHPLYLPTKIRPTAWRPQ